MTILKGHKARVVIKPVLFVAGILFFACTPRNPDRIFNLSYAGLILSAAVIAVDIRRPRDLLTSLGLNAISGKKLYYFAAGIVTGVILAMFYRNYQGFPLILSGFSYFAITAAAIGFIEEMLFRGYLQTQLSKISIPWSIVLATSSHTAYKVFLFNALKPVFEVNLLFLFSWTFVIGLVFGILKEKSSSTYTPIASHTIFDVLVYGDITLAPWWIWA